MGDIFALIGNLLKFCLWVLMGALIVPCMVVTSIFYPVWEKMGESIEM